LKMEMDMNKFQRKIIISHIGLLWFLE
jgi:hypothetical protein